MPVIKLRGLPWSCTPDDILKFLNGINITNRANNSNQFENAIYLTTNSEGRPSGEAFIEVVDENDLELALKRNNARMGQRYIEVFRSNPEQLNKHLQESRSNASNWSDPVVRLRGLPYGCTKQDIASFFDGLNLDYDGIMMVIDFSGRFNGEAFAQFVTILDAHKALEKHKQKISNRYIEVFRSTFAEMNNYSGNSNSSRSNNNKSINKLNKKNSNAFDSGSFRSNRSNSSNRSKPYSRNTNNNNNQNNNNNNSNSNRQKSSNTSGLPSLMSTDFTSNNSSFYVCENNHRHFLNGNNNDQESNNSNNNNYNNNSSRTKRPVTPPLPDSSSSSSRTTYGVRMRGLPYSVTEREIRDFFRPLNPQSVTMTSGRDGRPSGECECDFSSHSEACEAMKLDKKFIGNRYIELFLLSGSSKSNQSAAPLSFGSLMSKDFSSRNNSNNNNNNNNLLNDYDGSSYTSFESSNLSNTSPLPVPPPPAPLQSVQTNKSTNIPSLLGPLPPVVTNQIPTNNINELIFADMAKQMTQLYNQFQSQQQQQFFSNNNNMNNLMNTGTINSRRF